VREPHPIKGARASLFERLTVSSEAPGREGQSSQDYPSLVAAVGAELGRLLNTRCHVSGDLPAAAADTVLGYGVPDLTQFCPDNESDQARLAEMLEHKIAVYEPRLRDVRVVLAPSPHCPTGLTGRVFASLCAGTVYEPVSFPLSIDREGAQVGEAQSGMAI
jgi:type VI secretion system protein ImpF